MIPHAYVLINHININIIALWGIIVNKRTGTNSYKSARPFKIQIDKLPQNNYNKDLTLKIRGGVSNAEEYRQAACFSFIRKPSFLFPLKFYSCVERAFRFFWNALFVVAEGLSEFTGKQQSKQHCLIRLPTAFPDRRTSFSAKSRTSPLLPALYAAGSGWNKYFYNINCRRDSK